MTGKDTFKLWAPAGARWVDWVRPVPFIAMESACGLAQTTDTTLPSILYVEKPQEDVALVVDVPGAEGVKEGLALAQMGFRPIPLYNGTNAQQGAMALVDNHPIETALHQGAQVLEKLTIPPNAPPVFLLDSNRTHRYRMDASVFDNSWDIYEQDMPPAQAFLSAGIGKIIVRGKTIHKDLRIILHKYQKKGMAILFTDGLGPPQKVTVKKPLRMRD